MDPYLESPAIWHQVHTRLIIGIADFLNAHLGPDYRASVNERTYLLPHDEVYLAGIPDVAVRTKKAPPSDSVAQAYLGAAIEVLVPTSVEVREHFLEVRFASEKKVVTVIEVLSPSNKGQGRGRREYLRKREEVLDSRTSLVEVDLLRGGLPMPVLPQQPSSDYRILVSRASERPRALFLPFSVREAIPEFPVPLLPGDSEPRVEVGPILAELYERSRLEADVDYSRPPTPPLRSADAAWARRILGKVRPEPHASPRPRSRPGSKASRRPARVRKPRSRITARGRRAS